MSSIKKDITNELRALVKGLELPEAKELVALRKRIKEQGAQFRAAVEAEGKKLGDELIKKFFSGPVLVTSLGRVVGSYERVVPVRVLEAYMDLPSAATTPGKALSVLNDTFRWTVRVSYQDPQGEQTEALLGLSDFLYAMDCAEDQTKPGYTAPEKNDLLLLLVKIGYLVDSREVHIKRLDSLEGVNGCIIRLMLDEDGKDSDKVPSRSTKVLGLLCESLQEEGWDAVLVNEGTRIFIKDRQYWYNKAGEKVFVQEETKGDTEAAA